MSRKPLIAGNHKMNLTWKDSTNLVKELKPLIADVEEVEVAVCPPFTSLLPVSEELKGSKIALGAQNMHFADSGAFTGEVSVDMLEACGCTYVILGHSERRHVFGEQDSDIHKKVAQAAKAGVKPILCVGETLAEREAGQMKEVVRRQVEKGLSSLSGQDLAGLVVAYEPVWAIGTGKTATPEQANEACAYIRTLLAQSLGQSFATNVRILYGGSVKPNNVKELMECSDIDGALVGGASLKATDFAAIVRYYEQ